MKRSKLLLAAAALDWIVGDPESLPHPVRLLGAAITHGENLLYPASRRFAAKSPRLSEAELEFASGCLLAAAITAAAYFVPAILLRSGPKAVRPALAVLLASTTLAARNLDDEARAVLSALNEDDLPLARARVARIVGRDTAALDEPAVSRALIETLAESLSDGVVAPLFYLALGGVPAAMAFKAVSTMDSMIGHQTLRYLYFGRAAARLDDAANFLPARLTARAILAFRPAAAPAYRRDRSRHASPNAGHPEAAMAGVLGVQLGGPSTYAGEPHLAPLLNAGARFPTRRDARRALTITRVVAAGAALIAAGLVFAAETRVGKGRP